MTEPEVEDRGELTFVQRRILADAGITGPYTPPTVNCPHKAGTATAEEWWRAEWAKAVAWDKVDRFAETGQVDDYNDTLPVKPPPFPAHALPEPMRSLVLTIAANKCVPADLPALLALSCIGMAAGPRLVIDRGRDWLEPLVEWTLTILESGERKSPAFEVFQEILRKVEQHLADKHDKLVGDQVAEIQALIAVKTKGNTADGDYKGNATEKAAQAKGKQSRESDEVKAFTAQIERLQESPPPRLLVGGSSTSESIERAMERNGGAIGIMDDESGAFDTVSGVYNNGTPTGLDSILKGYSGHWIPANERIGREVKAIPRAIMSYGLTAQSSPLIASFRVPNLRNRGFHSRWCYAVPEAVEELLDPPRLDYDVVHEFTDLIIRLVELPVINPAENPRRAEWPTLTLTDEARKLHQEIQAEFKARKQPDTGDLGFMSDWANKFAGRVLRHAGLLHLAAGLGRDTPVGEDTMRAAIEIGRWAIPHAAEVYRRAPKLQAAGKGKQDDVLKETARFRVERWIRKTRKTHFTTRDVYNTVRRHSWCTSADQVQEALEQLDADWVVRKVKRYDALNREKPGYPHWVPHPDLIYGQ